MLATKSPQIRKAVGVLKELSADERTRMLFESREMARRDIESRVEDIDRELQIALVAIADKDAEIADKEAEISDKDAEIEKLRLMVIDLQNQ
jgi:hypothetical protein